MLIVFIYPHNPVIATDRLGCGKRPQRDLAHTECAALSRM
jgi:hypothetical protein